MTAFVYIVDDDDSLRASLFALLSTRSDLLISSYRSGDDFLAALPGLEAGIVLLDIHLPGTSGLDVMKALQEGDRGFCGIVITGHGDIATAVRSMKLGAIDFLEKPYDHPALFRAIDDAVARLDRNNRALERSRTARALVDTLSDREREVLLHLVDGRPNKAVAIMLGVSPRTVEVHRASVMSKLGVGSLVEAVRLAYAAGLLRDA